MSLKKNSFRQSYYAFAVVAFTTFVSAQDTTKTDKSRIPHKNRKNANGAEWQTRRNRQRNVAADAAADMMRGFRSIESDRRSKRADPHDHGSQPSRPGDRWKRCEPLCKPNATARSPPSSKDRLKALQSGANVKKATRSKQQILRRLDDPNKALSRLNKRKLEMKKRGKNANKCANAKTSKFRKPKRKTTKFIFSCQKEKGVELNSTPFFILGFSFAVSIYQRLLDHEI